MQTRDFEGKSVDIVGYLFTYYQPVEHDLNKSGNTGIYPTETGRGYFMINSKDNEYYVFTETCQYTFHSLVDVLDFICDTNSPKTLNSTIYITQYGVQNFLSLGLNNCKITYADFTISQDNLCLFSCKNFQPNNCCYDILMSIKRYCSGGFLLEKLTKYKNFN